jgi:hypothetical protein
MKKMFILVLALVMAFAAVPAFAQDKADWAFYGQVRMWTAWESVDKDTPNQLSNSGFFPVASTAAKSISYSVSGNQDDDEMAYLLQSNSRIGANVKWGNIGGRFEYGHTSTANLRLLYGTWNFGAGTLLLGQDYGPYFYLVSGLCGPGGAECNGIGFGSIYSGRNPQIKLIFGGLQLAIVKPAQVSSFTLQPGAAAALAGTTLPTTFTANSLILNNNQSPTTGTTATGFQDVDFTLPKLEASYTFNLGPAQLFIGGVYNKYTEVYNIAGVETENDVEGWALGIGTKMSFGPFYVNATAQYARNVNNSGSGPATLYPSVQFYAPQAIPALGIAAGDSEDADYMAAQLILGFKLTDTMVIEGGVVWQNGEYDDIEQTTWVYYIGFGWSPAKNVFIVPEFGIIDYKKLETPNGNLDFGDLTWLGIKWQINF